MRMWPATLISFTGLGLHDEGRGRTPQLDDTEIAFFEVKDFSWLTYWPNRCSWRCPMKRFAAAIAGVFARSVG